MRTYTTYIYILLALLPVGVFAATSPKDFKSFIAFINEIIGTVIILIFALTLVVFMWGIVKGWIINGGEAEGVANGKQVVMVGVIALSIMSAVWGIVYFLQTSLFGLQ